MSRRNRLTLVLFCAATPFVYSYVTGCWRSLPSPIQHALEPVALPYMWAFGNEAVGAGIAAVMLAAPLTWLVHRRSFFLALCLAAAATATLIPDLIIGARISYYRFVLLQLPALLAFFLFGWAAAQLVNWRIRRHAT